MRKPFTMIDFTKLRDPAYIAESRAQREAESRRLEDEAKRVWAATAALMDPDVEARLQDSERRFVSSCRSLVSRQYVLTPRQQEWLFDLADKHAPAWRGDESQDEVGESVETPPAP